ncbi:MAG TPA: mobile mystery protein B [Candidatus Omnitrophota bacterium]|nr:mobile mystery protein B [Candidatus Omnitrophota bacterium]
MERTGPEGEGTPLPDPSGLIPQHIFTKEALDRAEFANVSKVLPKYLLKKPSDRTAPFDFKWFLKLHEEMFGEVWDWAGKLRKHELNLGVAPAKIAAELHAVQNELRRREENKMGPLEIAVRLHYRLVWIHPFAGGNGRWARMAANIYLRKKGLSLILWPEDRITIQGKVRDAYIAALRKADQGDIASLVDLHKRFLEKRID